MKVYDFKCVACGKTQEHFVASSKVVLVVCKHCEGRATRQLSAPRFKLSGHDPAGFPTAYDKWTKDQYKRVREGEKQNGNGAE